ncbi:MAG: hypothetical protein ACFFDW_10895 [Candidatus Thorarchaeota archaeon]
MTKVLLESIIEEEKSNNIRHFFLSIIKRIKKLWEIPETKVILFLILSRLLFIIFGSWGIDYNFYIEIAQRVLTGEKLYVDFNSTHMPLVDMIYIAMYALCPLKSNPYILRIFIKLPFLLSDIGIALAIMRIVENHMKKHFEVKEINQEKDLQNISRAKLIAGYFVAFSLPLILQTGGGRYDSIMILCFTMVIFYLQKNNWFGVAFFAALGTSAKYIGIISLPFLIVWMKRENIKPFIFGLILGFLPIYPFLITCPIEFITCIFSRSAHIAYGFALWHAIYIIWNGFSMKYVDSIESTYDVADEPWFVSDLYIPIFLAIYGILFTFYIIRWWRNIRSEEINQQSLFFITNIVFIPIFIFGLTFKAINIQVLAWFTPYIALKKKLDLLLEYSFLTVANGIGLVFFESYNPITFTMLSAQTAAEGTFFDVIVVQPVLYIRDYTSSTVWVSLIFVTIIWYLSRTLIEFVFCSKETLKPLELERSKAKIIR